MMNLFQSSLYLARCSILVCDTVRLDSVFCIPSPAVMQSSPPSGTLQVSPEGLLENAVSGPSKCMA